MNEMFPFVLDFLMESALLYAMIRSTASFLGSFSILGVSTMGSSFKSPNKSARSFFDNDDSSKVKSCIGAY